MLKKVLVVCDIHGWAFHNLYLALKKNITTFELYDTYTLENPVIEHHKFDIILYLCDYQPELIKKNNIPREKLILAIRSNVQKSFYNNSDNVLKVAKIIAVSNQELKKRFEKMHNNVVLAPGGIHTDIFKFKPKALNEKLRIGWAGSRSNFGQEYRGIPIIKEACEQLGFEFVPAFREDLHRKHGDMPLYYYNEIDVYVDLSKGAGRQGGLLEAASCGVPVIASRVGVAEQLVQNNVTGLLCDRTVEDLKRCLLEITDMSKECVYKMHDTIEKEWSWKVHAKIFEGIFNEIN